MILVVLSTHAELASATARGRSYWETGELKKCMGCCNFCIIGCIMFNSLCVDWLYSEDANPAKKDNDLVSYASKIWLQFYFIGLSWINNLERNMSWLSRRSYVFTGECPSHSCACNHSLQFCKSGILFPILPNQFLDFSICSGKIPSEVCTIIRWRKGKRIQAFVRIFSIGYVNGLSWIFVIFVQGV